MDLTNLIPKGLKNMGAKAIKDDPDPVGREGKKGEDGLKVISIQIDARFPHIRP